MPKAASVSDVIAFWFSEASPEQWYKKDPAFDDAIRDRFEDTVEAALAERLDGWADEVDGCLALIILLDQFTRNIYRDTPRAFSETMSLRSACAVSIAASSPMKSGMAAIHADADDAQRGYRHSGSLIPLFAEHTNPLTHEYAVSIVTSSVCDSRIAIPFLGGLRDEEREFLTQPGSSF